MEVKFENKFTPIPNCSKCGGVGYITKKKTKVEGKQKPCKECIKACGFCPKCNNTGEVLGKPGKICKCKKVKDKSKEKDKNKSKDKSEFKEKDKNKHEEELK